MKLRRAGILALAFALLLAGAIPLLLGAAPASATGTQGWSQPMDVSAGTSQAAAPQIVAASDGSLTAVWQGFDGANTVIRTSRSIDRGSTWATPVTQSAPGQNASFPHIVITPIGSLTVAWDRFDGSAFAVQASHSADGSNWSAPYSLGSTGGEASSPQIVAAPNGTVTAVWQGFVGGSTVIQSSQSVGGTSWSAPVVVAAPGAAFSPQIVSAADNSVTAVWYGFDGTGYIIQSSHSATGSSWSVPTNASGTGPDAIGPQIAAGPNGALTVVWTRFDGSNNIVQSSHSANNGTTWGAPVTLSGLGRDAQEPQVRATPDGTVAVIWDRFDGSDQIVQASRSSDGSTWSAPLNLSAPGQNAASPQIVATPDSALRVVWSRNYGSDKIVQATDSVDGGATWNAAVDLSVGGQNAVTPQIAAGSTGAISAIWATFDGTNYAIQSAFIVAPPVFTSGALPAATAGVSYSFRLSANGAPLPTFAIASGALPPGLTFSAAGVVSGIPTVGGSFPLTITASNGVAPNATAGYTLAVGDNVPPIIQGPVSQTPAAASLAPVVPPQPTPTPQPTATPNPQPTAAPVVPPVLELVFGFTVGEHADGGGLTVTGNGFLPDSAAVVTLHSTPTILGSIAISPGGTFDRAFSLPTSLDPGVHHIEVAYTGSDGTATSTSWYFRVDKSGVAVNIQSQPTLVPPAWAQGAAHSPAIAGPGTVTVRGVAYQRYLPALHSVEAVDTVVSSLVLLTILGGVGAASVFAAGGSIAMAGSAAAAGGARGTTSPHSRTGESKSASLASAKVKHLKFQREATAWGDRSSTWAWFGLQRVDSISAALPVSLNRFSPLLARVSNDGAYLRAMFGPLWLLGSLAGIVLGVLSVTDTHGAAVPPASGLMIAIVVLSAFDVLGGLLAASTFTIGVIALGGLGTMAEVRTVLGIDVIFFTVALAASAARPLRRLPAQSASDWFDRTADVVIASLIATWAATKMIGALPALSGLALPIVDSAVTVAAFAGGAIAARYVLETVATYLYPLRLASVAPPKIGFPSARQQLVSAVLKTALFVFVAIAYLGNVWPLWIGAALFLIPSVVAAYQAKLPNVPRLVKLIPGGVIKIVLMLCVGKVLGGWLVSSIHNPQDLLGQAFVILAIPSLLLGFAGFFGREGSRWGLNWPMRVGGALLVGLGVLLVLGVVRIQ